MDRLVETTKLEEILRSQIASYAGPVESPAGISELFFVENPQKQIYCIVLDKSLNRIACLWRIIIF